MNTGTKVIERLYGEGLKVDREWSVRTPNGFRWWADKNAQTIEVVGEEEGPAGMVGYLISVRTDFLKSFELDEPAVLAINKRLMRLATMAGPVYDSATRTLSLCSLVRIHEGIAAWMNQFICDAALLQIDLVRALATEMAVLLKAEEAISGHPKNGERPEPDEMVDAIPTVVAVMGEQPCRCPVKEFASAVEQYMQQPPAIEATADGMGFKVIFPCSDGFSVFLVRGDYPHPRYGSGLFCLQSFPVSGLSDVEGAMLALFLNVLELVDKPTGYGFGSYAYYDSKLHFTSFFINSLVTSGLLHNLYYTSAERARTMSMSRSDLDYMIEIIRRGGDCD